MTTRESRPKRQLKPCVTGHHLRRSLVVSIPGTVRRLFLSLSPLTPPTPLLLTFTLLSSILTRQPITTYTYSLQSLHISQLTASHRRPNPVFRHPDSGLRARGTNIPYNRYNNIIFAALDAVGERAGLFPPVNVLLSCVYLSTQV